MSVFVRCEALKRNGKAFILGVVSAASADEWTRNHDWELGEATVPPWDAITDLQQLALETLGYSTCFGV